MSKKKTIFIISFAILMIIGIGIILCTNKFTGEETTDIAGEYKLIKVVMDKHDIDYTDLNFYYTFEEDGKGNIYFDDINSKFTYELAKNDGKTVLQLTQPNKDMITYSVETDGNNLVISNDNLGNLHLIKAEVPPTMKKQ